MQLPKYYAVFYGNKWKIYHSYHFEQFKNHSHFPLHGAEDRFEARVLLKQSIKEGFAGILWNPA